jgi:glutamine synthetase
LKGVDEGYELGPETSTEDGSSGFGADTVELPQSLAEALDAMEASSLVREALGDHIFTWFLRNKRAEWSDYRSQITRFELERYLSTW